MEERWLPPNYNGPRTAEEVTGDLHAIARWRDTSEAHVTVAPKGGQTWGTTGYVSAEDTPGRPCVLVRVDGTEAFVFDRDEFVGASLSTLDGADYYGLSIETTRGKMLLTDAYNGLGAPRQTLD